MYDSKSIRTGNMPADRSMDLMFDRDVEPSKTQQHFTAECDVNRIVKLGNLQPADPSQLRFADVSEVVAYEEALQIVMKAEMSFSAMPAEIRARFGNDPQQFVDFLADPANTEEAVKMGLAVKPDPVSFEPVKQKEVASEPAHE